MAKGVKIVKSGEEKAKSVRQNTSSYPYYIASVASSSWASDIENCSQNAKNSFDRMTKIPQSFLDTHRPLIFLVIFAQGHQHDIAFAQQTGFEFGIVVDFIALDQQFSIWN